MVQGLDNVGVAVRDLEQALAFFCDQLQLELAYRDDASRSAGVNTGTSSLYVFETSGPDGPQRTADYTGNPTGVDHLSFAVDDVDATYRELQERGVTFFMEPNDADWGARVCGCSGPGGTPVYFLKWAEAGA
jgi:catechol 2,3-dioxygenase-like lactoylglutathione lyase family enzyme